MSMPIVSSNQNPQAFPSLWNCPGYSLLNPGGLPGRSLSWFSW